MFDDKFYTIPRTDNNCKTRITNLEFSKMIIIPHNLSLFRYLFSKMVFIPTFKADENITTMNNGLTTKDLEILRERGLSSNEFEAYHHILKTGYPFISLADNCNLFKEIKHFEKGEIETLRNSYKNQKDLKILKFVPASGAASRMFKDLFSALETGVYSGDVSEFFKSLSGYAFAKELFRVSGVSEKMDYSSEEKKQILQSLLLPEGMNYGNLPKGIIAFHKYNDGHVRTAFEEHFHESAMYARSGDICHLHFTVPADQVDLVKSHLESLCACLGKAYDVKFEIQTSIQKSTTDTPAIYEDNLEWVREDSGKFLFRPAGHGALLENLNDLDADIIFVKNIDNIVPDRLKPITVEYKELLAGVLLKTQDSVFKFLEDIDNGKLDKKLCSDFVSEWLNFDISNLSEIEIKSLLNRPLRVCGMVKNEGEPGGGPFIVNDENGETSLQIVEGAQIDSQSSVQMEVAKKATHFNPVDLVVGTKDYRGNKFNLIDFRNDNTGMVVLKNYQGRNIKALELPGLWNGSMHFWNTIFVEVPIETFNPVKTVFDLRRDAHTA